MNLVNTVSPVAVVEISESELKTLYQNAAAAGRDLKTYLLQGVECALDMALKRAKDNETRITEEKRAKARADYHEARLEFDRLMKIKPEGTRRYGTGKPRDYWGNLKRT